MSVRNIAAMMIALFALTVFTSPAAAFRNIEEGAAAPAFTLKDTAGKTFSLSEAAGKAVVVVFVKPDQDKSVDAVKDLQEIFAKLGGKDVVILALMPETEQLAKMKEVAEQEKVGYPVLLDEGRKVYGEWGVFLFPTTGILGKDGKLIKHISSHNRKYKETVDGYVRLALGEIDEAKLEGILHPREKEELTAEQKKAERHMMLAQRMVDRKMLDRAAHEYEQAVESDPELVEARVKYGFVLLKMGETDKAKENFEKALELDAKAEDGKTGLGSAHVAAGELDKGIEVLESSLKLNPKPARAHFELGKAYEKKGDTAKALVHFKAAAEDLGGAAW